MNTDTDAGLVVLAEARWPEEGDGDPPALPGFVLSSFNPLVAAVADRCLHRRHGERPAPSPVGERTAVVLASVAGDRASADHVRQVVADGGRLGPLFFFQSVPNSVLGYVSARWGLGGPVLCVAPTADPRADSLAEASLLLHDGDADEVLLLLVEQAPDDGGTDRAGALLVARGDK